MDGNDYQLLPALFASYGYVDIGDIGMTGTAYGVVDDTLVLDAGHVSVARISFAPEVLFPLDRQSADTSQSTLGVVPRVSCEWIDGGAGEDDCGGGLGFTLRHVDLASGARFNAGYDYEKVGARETSSVSMNLEIQF